MLDTVTQKPLRIGGVEGPRPYIRLAYAQVPEVRRVLDEHRIRYHVREDVMSFNGGPEIAYIDLGRGADVGAIQAVLDSAR